MNDLVIEYPTLALSQQVLERQQQHAQRIAGYLPANADIGDATGLLLGMFDPLSRGVVEFGVQVAEGIGQVEQVYAGSVGSIAQDIAATDTSVGETFEQQLGRVSTTSTSGTGSSYTDLGGPSLGPAAQAAPDGYGDVNSYWVEKAWSTGENLGNAAGDGRQLVDSVGQWARPGQVTEVTDASSFLVPGQAPDNFVQDLRWSAGALLGSIDWVAEQFIGFSILERCVFEPLAGDWQGIYRASEAWKHAGDAVGAIGRNHAGLVASTPMTWEGLAGTAFRATMTASALAAVKVGSAYEVVGTAVKTISQVCKLVCTGIGKLLNLIADKLLAMAAKAATPVVGWVAGAVTAYDDINDIVKNVRRIYTLIETVMSAIESFSESATDLMESWALVEDLLQGAAGTAQGAAT